MDERDTHPWTCKLSWPSSSFITETKVTLRENLILEALNYDIDVPCPLQWALLWFSAPTNLNRKFTNSGTKVAKFRETVNSAIELTCSVAFDGTHTPRKCFFRAVTVLLSYAPDKDWDLKEEMQGWRVGEDRIARLSDIRGSVGRAVSDAGIH